MGGGGGGGGGGLALCTIYLQVVTCYFYIFSPSALENKKREIEEATMSQFQTLMPGDTVDPDPHKIKREIDEVHKQAREIERHLKKLENEKKILAFHK